MDADRERFEGWRDYFLGDVSPPWTNKEQVHYAACCWSDATHDFLESTEQLQQAKSPFCKMAADELSMLATRIVEFCDGKSVIDAQPIKDATQLFTDAYSRVFSESIKERELLVAMRRANSVVDRLGRIPSTSPSLAKQRYQFERDWRKRHPTSTPGEMRQAYIAEHPDDEADAKAFQNARYLARKNHW